VKDYQRVNCKVMLTLPTFSYPMPVRTANQLIS
jgi:hypothetical protein